MGLDEILSHVELFQGLTSDELGIIGSLFQERSYERGEVIATQGTPGESLFLISEGFVEVKVAGHSGSVQPSSEHHVLINLGRGQIVGEMSLVDQGPRSATVSAISSPTVVHSADRLDFLTMCENHPHIGFLVMRNIAADLSFKLRKQNLDRI
jgi:CRP-like cAMP-binding protein